MNKKDRAFGISIALLGGVLLWLSGNNQVKGIAGWETVNTQMEQMISANTDSGQPTDSSGGKLAKEANVQPTAIPALSNTQTEAPSASKTVEGTVKTEAIVAPATEGMVNVNTAEVNELMNLPGIGTKKAEAVIDYRKSHGLFKGLADLGKVKGIGPKMLEKLKPLVSF